MCLAESGMENNTLWLGLLEIRCPELGLTTGWGREGVGNRPGFMASYPWLCSSSLNFSYNIIIQFWPAYCLPCSSTLKGSPLFIGWNSNYLVGSIGIQPYPTLLLILSCSHSLNMPCPLLASLLLDRLFPLPRMPFSLLFYLINSYTSFKAHLKFTMTSTPLA